MGAQRSLLRGCVKLATVTFAGAVAFGATTWAAGGGFHGGSPSFIGPPPCGCSAGSETTRGIRLAMATLVGSDDNRTLATPTNGETPQCSIPAPPPNSGCGDCAWTGTQTQDWCIRVSPDCSWLPWAKDELMRRRIYKFSCPDGKIYQYCAGWQNAGTIKVNGCPDEEGNKLCCTDEGSIDPEPLCGTTQERPCSTRLVGGG